MEEEKPEPPNHPPKGWDSEVMVLVTGQPPSAAEEEAAYETVHEGEVETIPEAREPLSLLEVLRLSAVLEDTIDQLSILNYIMPVQYERQSSGTGLTKLLKNYIAEADGEPAFILSQCPKYWDYKIVPSYLAKDCYGVRVSTPNFTFDLSLIIYQKSSSLEKHLMMSTMRKLSTPISPKERTLLLEAGQRARSIQEFNKMQDVIFKKPTRQTIMTAETLKKIQNDRQFFSEVIENTMQELQDSGTFTYLLQALTKERENKMHFYEVIAREEKGRKQIRSLQKQLINVKKERQTEVQSRNEYIAHLKDQLQEMKAKTNLENHYMKRNTELQISQTQKKCNKTEELLLEEIEKIRMKTEEENRIHMEIEMFLKKEQQKLEEKLEFWMEKFDKDTEMKQNELNALKALKASDLGHLQDLAKTIREYEQVIIEDRIEKEKTRKKIEQEDLELKSILKIQAWWRGTVVRREIGSFRMPKKDKDDSKDSKGKGKDKDKRRGKK